MDIVTKLNTALNAMYNTFDISMVPDLGLVPVRTGVLIKDAFMYYCETTYGIEIRKFRRLGARPDPGNEGWSAHPTNDPRMTLLLLQL